MRLESQKDIMRTVSHIKCREHVMARTGKGHLDLVVYICNVALQRSKLVDHEFKASLGYVVEFRVTLLYMKPCVKFPDNTPKLSLTHTQAYLFLA